MDPVSPQPLLPTQIERGPHERFLGALLQGLYASISGIANRLNECLPKDGTEAMKGPIVLKSYTVATRPAAASYTGGFIYVSDGGAGAVFQGSNGASWVNLG